MKQFVVYYEDIEGENAEYWVKAKDKFDAMLIFNRAGKLGELDYPCSKIVNVRERD